jgi:flagellar hook-associated protein 3 FlgL
MRISTIQAFNNGVNGIQQNYADVTRTQEQISSGKKVLTPADDPVAAVRLLQLDQEQAALKQFDGNLIAAKNSLTLEESTLNGVGNVMQRIRELAVQAGNGALSKADRGSIAAELTEREDELLGLMNSKNARGEYLFGGFQGKSQPFVRDAAGNYSYLGDEGQRQIQIASSQQVAISDNGKVVFDRVVNAARLQGGSITPALAGSTLKLGEPLVEDEVAFAGFPASGVEIEFEPAPNQKTYNLYAYPRASNPVALTNPARQLDDNPERGDQLRFRGVSVHLDGVPAGGERFFIGSPASSQVAGGQGFITNMATFLGAYPAGSTQATVVDNAGTPELQIGGVAVLLTPALTASPATYPAIFTAPNGFSVRFESLPQTGTTLVLGSTPDEQSQGILNTVATLRRALEGNADNAAIRDFTAAALTNLDNGMAAVLSAQGEIGARLNVVESTQTNNEDLALINKSVQSGLQDLDYAEALSRLSFQSIILEAAQQSYVKISSLNLFNQLR